MGPEFIGFFIGSFLSVGAVSRIFLFILRSWNGGTAKVLVAHAFCYAVLVLIAGAGMADGGAFAPLQAAGKLFLPQAIWFAIDVVRDARANRA